MTPTDYIKALKSTKTTEQIQELIHTLSGVDSRFERQAIAEELTGVKHPLVKCGISHLLEYTQEYLAKKLAEKEARKNKKDNEPLNLDGPDAEEKKPAREKKEKDTNPLAIPMETKMADLVGLKVTRKECGRIGVVTEAQGQKVTVTLEDGDIRRPNFGRFIKLYLKQE
jgi:hypothetical protein